MLLNFSVAVGDHGDVAPCVGMAIVHLSGAVEVSSGEVGVEQRVALIDTVAGVGALADFFEAARAGDEAVGDELVQSAVSAVFVVKAASVVEVDLPGQGQGGCSVLSLSVVPNRL